MQHIVATGSTAHRRKIAAADGSNLQYVPNKEIKFDIGVNMDSAQKTKRVIQEITAEINLLVAATKNMGGALGGGMLGGARVTSFTGGTPHQNATRATAQAGGGGITDNLTRAVQNSAALFKGAATGSKDAFRVMSDSLRGHVQESDREITKLTNKLDKLGQVYDRLKTRQSSGFGGKLTDSAIERVQGEYYGTAGQLDTIRSRRGKLIKAQTQLDTEGDLQGVNGPVGRARGFFSQFNEGVSKVGGRIGQALGVPSSMMKGAGMFGAVGAGIAAGLAISTKMMSLESQTIQANNNYGIQKPFYSLDAKASIGSVFGGNALSLRHMDLARAITMTRMHDDKDVLKIMGVNQFNLADNEMSKRLMLKRTLENPVTAGELTLTKGPIGAAKSGLGGLLGSGLTDIGGYDWAGTNNVNTIARRTAEQEAMAQKVQMYQKALDARMAADPMFVERTNRFASGAMGDIALARAAHISGGVNKYRSNRDDGDSVREFQARSQNMFYSDSERISAMHELAGTAGMGFFGRGDSILNPKAGGLSSAAAILGAGSQFGGGSWKAGKALLGTVQNMIGAGGLDITAGNKMAELGVGLMNSGQFMGGAPGSGSGIMKTLMEAASTGTTGGDMRMAGAMAGGIGAMGNLMSGGIDPLQKALNYSAALQAAPGGSPMLKDALLRMTPAERMEFERSGGTVVPAGLASVGVTPDILKKYLGAQNRTMFARVTSAMTGGASSATGSAIERFRSAGGLGYMKGWKRDKIQQELQDLAPGAVFAGLADDNTQGLAYMRSMAAGEKLLTGVKGSGAGSSFSGKSARADILRAQGKLTDEEAKDLAYEEDLERQGAKLTPQQVKQMEALRRKAQAAVNSENPEQAINDIDGALRTFVTSLRAMVSGTSTGQKAGPKLGSLEVPGMSSKFQPPPVGPVPHGH